MALSSRTHIFITGSGRCGTTLLRNLLDGHSRIEVIPGEASDLIGEVWRNNGYSLSFRAADPVMRVIRHHLLGCFDGLPCAEAVAGRFAELLAAMGDDAWGLPDFLDAFLSRVVESDKDHVLIDLTNENIKGLLEQFPHARIIHMLRDPFETMNSHYRFRFADANSFGGAFPGRWEFSESFARVARAFDQAKAFSGHPAVHVLRLEDLQSEPEGKIRAALAFLGLEFEDINDRQTRAGIDDFGNSTKERSARVLAQASDISCLTASDLHYISCIRSARDFYSMPDSSRARNGFLAFAKRQLGYSGVKRGRPASPGRFAKVLMIAWGQYIADVAGKHYLQAALNMEPFDDWPCL